MFDCSVTDRHMVSWDYGRGNGRRGTTVFQ